MTSHVSTAAYDCKTRTSYYFRWNIPCDPIGNRTSGGEFFLSSRTTIDHAPRATTGEAIIDARRRRRSIIFGDSAALERSRLPSKPVPKHKCQNASNIFINLRSITCEPRKLQKSCDSYRKPISGQVSLASDWHTHKGKRWIITSCGKLKSMTTFYVLLVYSPYSVIFQPMPHPMSGFGSTIVSLACKINSQISLLLS